MVTRLGRKLGMRKLRRIMRGYASLRDAGRLALVGDIKRELTTHRLDIPRAACSRVVLGAGVDAGEQACRRLLLTRLAGLSLNRILLHSVGTRDAAITHGLPSEWRSILRGHGFHVASLRSALLWQGFIAMMFGYGLQQIALILKRGIAATIWGRAPALGGSQAHFHALGMGNLPKPCADGRSHDILTWYMQWDGRIPGVAQLTHDVKGAKAGAIGDVAVLPVEGPMPPLAGWATIARFMGWTMAAVAIAFTDCLRGRWWHAAMLGQAAHAAHMRLLKAEARAQDYLFHNSGWFSRPLWTYEAAQAGSRILFYFYSTNCELFEREGIETPINYGWQAMDWPEYLVWDDWQADFIRTAVGNAALVSNVGPIWFQTCDTEVPAIPARAVAVFDVQPVRTSFYATLGFEFDYYTPVTAMGFIAEVQAALADDSRAMCLKRKREVGRLTDGRYMHLVNELVAKGAILEIKPETAAVRLIEACSATISMPFTSTALIARAQGKPSCYYDPTGMVLKKDRAAHGIPVLHGRSELRDWLKSI